jgi:hypothetical protein
MSRYGECCHIKHELKYLFYTIWAFSIGETGMSCQGNLVGYHETLGQHEVCKFWVIRWRVSKGEAVNPQVCLGPHLVVILRVSDNRGTLRLCRWRTASSLNRVVPESYGLVLHSRQYAMEEETRSDRPGCEHTAWCDGMQTPESNFLDLPQKSNVTLDLLPLTFCPFLIQ